VSADGTLLVIAAFAAGLVAGGQLFVLIAIVPLRRRWPDAIVIPVHQDLLAITADKWLRPVLGVAFTTGIAALAVHHDVDGVSGVSMIVALVACAGVMVMSFRFNFPLNRRVAELERAESGGAYAELGRRWDVAHGARTAFGTIAFAAFLLAVATL
jgi:apolipoprotein N-acyltransferase